MGPKEDTTMKDFFNAFEIRLTNSLAQKINDSETKILTQMNTKFTNLEQTIKENSVKVNNNTIQLNTVTGIVNTNTADISDLRTELAALQEETQNIRGDLAEQKLVFVQKVEDLTNRSLRKNIVIRGIPEDEDEKSWEDTKRVVSQAIADATGENTDRYMKIFERIHRGKKSNDPKNTFPRPIFAIVHDWNEIDRLSEALRKAPPNNIYVDQQYGPITTYRRNQAFLKRRDLKKSKTIVGGFVKFPAKLFVKYGATSSNVFCEDFSSIPIPDDILDKALAS
jgi:hypothetical protein